ALKASEATGRAATNSPHSGFQRLTSRQVVLIMDVGAPPNNPTPTMGCAGTLSFELSIYKQRLVVNCGVPKSGHQKMMSALLGNCGSFYTDPC
ncbi:MAG: heparinase II/III family protein, partial [Rhodospirillales bacterium]